jgi:hypothetical protein
MNAAMMRSAAVLAWILGVGFGGACPYAIWYLADHGRVWMVMDLPTYGNGPFEDIGITTTVPLLSAIPLVCAADSVVGWILWTLRRNGILLALALLPFEFAFWIGFALTLGPLLGLTHTALVLVAGRHRGGEGPYRRPPFDSR